MRQRRHNSVEESSCSRQKQAIHTSRLMPIGQLDESSDSSLFVEEKWEYFLVWQDHACGIGLTSTVVVVGVIRYVLFTSGLEVEFSIAEFQIITHAPQQQPTIQHRKAVAQPQRDSWLWLIKHGVVLDCRSQWELSSFCCGPIELGYLDVSE